MSPRHVHRTRPTRSRHLAPRRAHTAGPAEDVIQDRIDRGWTAGQIHEELERLGRHGSLKGLTVPSKRTIERRVAARIGPDDEPWNPFHDIAGGAAAPLVRVVAAVISRTEGRRVGITQAEARAIGTILEVAPDIDPWLAYRLGRRVVEGEVETVTHYLAYGPWRDDAAADRYRQAFDAGWIPELLILGPEGSGGSLRHMTTEEWDQTLSSAEEWRTT